MGGRTSRRPVRTSSRTRARHTTSMGSTAHTAAAPTTCGHPHPVPPHLSLADTECRLWARLHIRWAKLPPYSFYILGPKVSFPEISKKFLGVKKFMWIFEFWKYCNFSFAKCSFEANKAKKKVNYFHSWKIKISLRNLKNHTSSEISLQYFFKVSKKRGIVRMVARWGRTQWVLFHFAVIKIIPAARHFFRPFSWIENRIFRTLAHYLL